MVSFSDFKYIVALFYLFGQVRYCPYYNGNRIAVKILGLFPFALLVAMTTFCSWIFISSEPPKIMRGTSFVLYVFRFTLFVPNFVMIIDNLIHWHDFGHLLNKVFFVCNSMGAKLNAQFQLRKFKSECSLGICICLTVIIITHINRIYLLFVFDLKTEMVIFFLQFSKTLSMLHAVFYINFFKFILITMNDAIIHKDFSVVIPSKLVMNAACRRSKQLSQSFFWRTRFIYLELWQLIEMFNKHFGWFLVSIMFESTISATNAFYGAFVYFSKTETHIYYISRKYFVYSCIWKLFVCMFVIFCAHYHS